MNDILIAKRPHGKALVIGETQRGKVWMHKNMISEDGVTWVSSEGIEEIVELMKQDHLIVEVI